MSRWPLLVLVPIVAGATLTVLPLSAGSPAVIATATPTKVPTTIRTIPPSATSTTEAKLREQLGSLPTARRDPSAVLQLGSRIFGSTSDSLLAALLEFQEAVDKETRADRTLAEQSKELELLAKAKRLSQDESAIDEGMKEASEKANNAMEAASVSLIMGVIGGTTSMAAGAGQIGGGTAPIDGGPHRIEVGWMGGKSPVRMATIIDVVLGGKLASGAREALRSRRRELLTSIADAWRMGKPVTTALRALFEKDPRLTSADRSLLFPLAVVEAYLQAMDDLRAIVATRRPDAGSGGGSLAALPGFESAATRARASLRILSIVTRNLSGSS